MDEELPDGDSDNELHGDQLLVVEQVAFARLNGAIRMGDFILRIIARDNLARLISPSARMPAPSMSQRAGPSGLNAHLPHLWRHVDFSDEEKPKRQVLLLRRLRVEFDVGDYEQEEDIKPKPRRRRKRAKRRANLFIDAESGVDREASSDEGRDEENDDLDEVSKNSR